MDINTLPQEMLGNVLKYQDFRTLLQLRKLSFQIDRIAKRYGMVKLPVYKIKISCRSGGSALCINLHTDERTTTWLGLPKNDIYKKKFVFEEKIDSETLNEKLTEYSKRVTIADCLCISNNIKVDETLLSVLSNQKELFKNCKVLTLNCESVDLSVKQNKKLLSIFPKLDEIDIEICDNYCTTLVNKRKLISQGGGQVWLEKVHQGEDIPYNLVGRTLRSIKGITSVEHIKDRFEVQLDTARHHYITFSLDDPDN